MTKPPPPEDAVSSAWARIRRNVAILLGERAIFAVVNVLAAGVATRATGLEAIGAIGLLHAYARVIGDTLKFQSWQAVIRYGAPLREAGDRPTLRRLIGLTLWIDIAAVALSLAAGWIGALWLGDWLGWSDEMIRYAPWFCIIIAFMTQMTPTGVLRLFDRVPVIAAQHAVTATVRLIGAAAIWIWGGGVFELALVWVLSAVIAGLVIYVAAWIVSVKEQATPRMAAALREGTRGVAGFWGFVTATNLISTLDNAVPFVATLIVGATLGPAEAGVFHLVRQITEAMVRPGDMLSPLFFPEIALMEAKGDRRALRRLIVRGLLWSGLIVAAAVLILALAGRPLLVLLYGAEAAAGYEVLVLAGIASGLIVWGFALEPTLLSLGRAGGALWSMIVAWIAFGALCWALLPGAGLVGVGLAMIGHRGVQFAIRIVMVARLLAR